MQGAVERCTRALVRLRERADEATRRQVVDAMVELVRSGVPITAIARQYGPVLAREGAAGCEITWSVLEAVVAELERERHVSRRRVAEQAATLEVAATAITEQRRLMQRVLDAVPGALVVVDVEGRVAVANRASEAILATRLGESPYDAMPLVLDDGTTPLSLLEQPHHRALRGELVRDETLRAGPKPGVIRVWATALRDDEGVVVGAVLLHRDDAPASTGTEHVLDQMNEAVCVILRHCRVLLATLDARTEAANDVRQIQSAALAARARGPAAARCPVLATVLLVEDEVSLRRVITRLLVRHGYEVIDAGTAEDATALVQDRDVDLLLTDEQLPGGSGLELAEELSRARPGLRVIVATGGSARDLATRARDARVLEKPFSPDTLLREVEAVLGPRNR
jgi:CheY-like chemotaxis protein